jgi:mRNA interferase MazF
MGVLKKSYIPERGDVVIIDFDPTKGHEQSGRRPALILSERSYNKMTNLCFAVPITSKTHNYFFERDLPPGFKTNGVAICNQVRPMCFKDRNITFAEKMDNEFISEVMSLIRAFFK